MPHAAPFFLCLGPDATDHGLLLTSPGQVTPHTAKTFSDPVPMGSLPENLSAAGATGKFPMRVPDIPRNFTLNIPARNILKDPVAERTSDLVSNMRLQIHRFENLSQLRFQVLIGDQ